MGSRWFGSGGVRRDVLLLWHLGSVIHKLLRINVQIRWLRSPGRVWCVGGQWAVTWFGHVTVYPRKGVSIDPVTGRSVP